MSVRPLPGAPDPSPFFKNRVPKTTPASGIHGPLCHILLFAFLVLFTFSPVFLSRASIYDVDLRHVETPIKSFLFKEQSGRLWTERIGCGFPIHAYGEGGLFYPLNWILYPLFSMPVAHDLNLMIHLFLAAAGAFLLGRRYCRYAAASAVSGVVFAFSGFMWIHMGHVNSIQACAWAPWAFLALDTEKRSPRLISVIGLSFCISLMLLTRVQYAFYTVLALGFHAAWKDLSRPRAPRFLLSLLGATLLAFLIAAAQVLPTLEFVMHSDRSGGIDYNAQLLGSVSWSQVLWLFAPLWNEGQTQGVTAESIGYLGITTAFLMLICFMKSGRKSAPWIFLMAVSLLLSMGNNFPLNALVYRIPGFTFFRCHARWIFVTGLAAAMLAGWGTDRLLLAFKDPLRRNLLGLLLVLLVFLDLSHFLRPLIHFVDRSAQESVPEAVAVLSEGGRYFVNDTPAVFVPEKEANRHPPEWLRRYFSASEPLNANLGARYGLSSVQAYAGLYPRWSSPAIQEPSLEDLRSMGCRYVVSREPIPASGLREVWRNPFLRVYLNERSEPRVRVLSSIESEGNVGHSAKGETAGTAKILQHKREDELRVSVHSQASGFLILADTFYPGWKAFVSGAEEKIFRVNGWMRAVPVPEGESEVLFQYRPASFTWGILVSGASLLLSVLAAVLSVFSRTPARGR